MYTVYGLLNKGACVYVGCTKYDPAIRLQEHVDGKSKLSNLIGSNEVRKLKIHVFGQYAKARDASERERDLVAEMAPSLNPPNHVPYPGGGRYRIAKEDGTLREKKYKQSKVTLWPSLVDPVNALVNKHYGGNLTAFVNAAVLKAVEAEEKARK
jgi:hypothetical protein